MNREKAVTGIYEGIREKLKKIAKEIDELEIMTMSLEIRETMEYGDAAPFFIPEEEEDPVYDFEGKGILLVTPGRVMEFLTCEEADEKLDEIAPNVEVWPIDRTPFLAAFSKRDAKYHGSSCFVDGEVLIFANAGEKIRPLTISEVGDICRYFDDNKNALNLDDTDQHLLVLV
ncbi:MAG: hypothetical protein E7240_08800 [Lachnospiraceae bacterium]|nr:hypothetical protein [Lachnospiraceae bacterium]